MNRPNPNTELNDMMDTFQTNAHNLLSFSQKSLRAFEKGLYGVVFAKLSRRLESVMSVDREVAIIFSTFPSLQARTIKFARNVISDEGVRLDPTLSIIVHKDSRGNNKLKNWGRQDGLTVLPIYIKGEMPAGEDLERALSRELFSHDLFDVTGPVSDDSQFYGRRTEAQELGRKLQRGQIHACLGIRKIGKTSILNRVVNQLREYHESICVVIDCSKDSIWSLDASNLMWSIATCIHDTIEARQSYAAVSPRIGSKPISEGCQKLTNAIQSSDRVVVIFLDEIDYITPGSNTATHWKSEFAVFWRNFRAVYQELTRDSKRNLSLLISGVSSKWFSVQSINNVENAALSLIPEEYLSPLPRGATLAMIRDMSRQSGLVFTEMVREKIAEVSADIPFWVRKACSFIHRQIPIEDRPHEPRFAEIDHLLNRFVESEGAVLARVALHHLFTVYPELEDVVYSCYEGNGEDCPKHLIEKLRQYGIILQNDYSRELSGDMMRAGFEDYLEERTSAPQTVANRQTGGTLGDWADDLAIINKRRNTLEKDLRETTVYFIKSDSLRNKNKGTVKDRLLKAVQPNRRTLLKEKSDREMIDGFLWSELCTLVEQEWKLFEPIFSDRKKFHDNWDIVNDRPDAHAKPVDPADFALQLRALDWLTTKLNR